MGKLKDVVGKIGFGMGIGKSNMGFVVNMFREKSMENFY